MPGKNIFVSSTCYDLIDVRAELETFIRSQGFSPVLSDSATSDFEVEPTTDSIETCLINVRQCDIFVMILSQRYGPSLKKTGYPDLSATHLEYETAKTEKKPILVYIRDHLLASYNHWKSQKPQDFCSPWLLNKDIRLLELIDEHVALVPGDPNWYHTFASSVELKDLIFKDLRARRPDVMLRNLIENNMVPDLRIHPTSSMPAVNGGEARYDLIIYNNGGVLANNVEIIVRTQARGEITRNLAQFIQANEHCTKGVALPIGPGDMPIIVALRYFTQTGLVLEDVFRMGFNGDAHPHFRFAGKRLIDQENIVLTGPLDGWETWATK